MATEGELRLAELKGWWEHELGRELGTPIDKLLDRYLGWLHVLIRGIQSDDPTWTGKLEDWEDVFHYQLLHGREPNIPFFALDALKHDLEKARERAAWPERGNTT